MPWYTEVSVDFSIHPRTIGIRDFNIIGCTLSGVPLHATLSHGDHIKMEVRALLRTGLSSIISVHWIAPCGRSEANCLKARKLVLLCFCFHIRKYWKQHSSQIVTFSKAAQPSFFIADSISLRMKGRQHLKTKVILERMMPSMTNEVLWFMRKFWFTFQINSDL